MVTKIKFTLPCMLLCGCAVLHGAAMPPTESVQNDSVYPPPYLIDILSKQDNPAREKILSLIASVGPLHQTCKALCHVSLNENNILVRAIKNQATITPLLKYLSIKDIANLGKTCCDLRLFWDHDRPIIGQAGKAAKLLKVIKSKHACNPTTLYLDYQDNLTELPKEIRLVTHLRKLALLPSTLSLCSQLDFCTSLGELTSPEITNIAKDIKGCWSRLEILDLSERNISPQSLSDIFIESLQLQELYLCRCDLQELPKEMQYLKQLTILDLSFNKNLGLQELSNMCTWLPQLQELRLLECNLQELPKEMQYLKQLTALNLSGNRISQQALKNICSWLPQLHALNLNFCALTEMPEEIKELKNLEKLYISNNNLSQEQKDHIEQLLPHTEIKF